MAGPFPPSIRKPAMPVGLLEPLCRIFPGERESFRLSLANLRGIIVVGCVGRNFDTNRKKY